MPVLGTVSELLEAGVDYAVVASPTATHLEIGLRTGRGRVYAHCWRNRWRTTLAAASKLVKAFEDADLVAGVGHIERYNPSLQSLRTRLETTVNLVKCSRSSLVGESAGPVPASHR